MDRLDFLKVVWRRVISPILLFALIYLSIRFLIDVITEDGFLILFIVGFVILLAVAMLLGIMFNKMITQFSYSLSKKIRTRLSSIKRVIDIISPFLMIGAIIFFLFRLELVQVIIIAIFFVKGLLERLGIIN